MPLYDLKEMDVAYEVTTGSTDHEEPPSAPSTPVSQETLEPSVKPWPTESNAKRRYIIGS